MNKISLKIPTAEEIKIAKAKKRYIDYVEHVHHGRWIAGRHHELICAKLDGVIAGEIKRLMFFLPPRHGKSMAVTKTFPSYYLGKFPDRRVLEVSYGDDLAKSFGESNRKKIEEFGIPIFGISISRSQSSKVDWNIEGREGGMVSVGVGGGITGKGADLLILDDPIKNRTEAESPRFREYLYSEWQSSIYTRLHPNATIIIILTRWHEDDLAARLIKESVANGENWDIVSLPCICDSENDLLGRKIGEPLWPEHGFDLAWADTTKKTIGSYAWSSLYMQQPSPSGGSILKRSWIQYYHTAPASFDLIVQSWDCTFKEGTSNDYVSGQVWGRKGANFYLLDRVHDRMGITQTIHAIRMLTAKWPSARSILIEDKANGTAVIEMLRKQIAGIIPVEPMGGKVVRTQAVAPYFEAGNVYLPAPELAPWIGDVVEEFVKFPNAQNDDDVDAMSQALSNMQNVYQALVYPAFLQEKHVLDTAGLQHGDVLELALGLHLSTGKVSVASLIGYSRGFAKAMLLDGIVFDHRQEQDFGTENFLSMLKNWLKMSLDSYKGLYITIVCKESDKAVFKSLKTVSSAISLRSIENNIADKDKIQLVSKLLSEERLQIAKERTPWIHAMETVEWKDSSVDNKELQRNESDLLSIACLSSMETALYKNKRQF